MTEGGPLSSDFSTAKKKLIPILYSHGLTGSRLVYQVNCRELASHGYLVFAMDHLDGSCCYTEKKTDKGIEPAFFDYSTPFYNYEDMRDKVKFREQEVRRLIDFIASPGFLQHHLNMDNRARLALDRLVMAGHSMGGATALRVANSDPRVKCILTHDPWLAPMTEEIRSGSFCNFSQEAILLFNNHNFIHEEGKNLLLHELIPSTVLKEHAILHGASHNF